MLKPNSKPKSETPDSEDDTHTNTSKTKSKSATSNSNEYDAIFNKYASSLPVVQKASADVARKEANAGFRPSDSAKAKASASSRASKPKNLVKVGALLMLPRGLNHDGTLNIAARGLPTNSDLDAYKAGGLYVTQDRNHEPLAFCRDWTQKQVDKWARKLLPDVFRFLDVVSPKAKGELHWRLLEKERRKNTLYKGNEITGETLSRVKGPVGKGYTQYTIRIISTTSIPKSIWSSSEWDKAIAKAESGVVIDSDDDNDNDNDNEGVSRDINKGKGRAITVDSDSPSESPDISTSISDDENPSETELPLTQPCLKRRARSPSLGLAGSAKSSPATSGSTVKRRRTQAHVAASGSKRKQSSLDDAELGGSSKKKAKTRHVSTSRHIAQISESPPLFEPLSPDSAIMHYEPEASGSRRSVTPVRIQSPEHWRTYYHQSPETTFKVHTPKKTIWD